MMTRQRTVYWLPRMLGLFYLGFISLFALDVLAEASGLADTLLALVIHLIPSLLLLLILGIAWRHEWLGGFLFVALGMATCVFFNSERPQTSLLLINSPLFLIGALFWLCAFCRRSFAPSGSGVAGGPGGEP